MFYLRLLFKIQISQDEQESTVNYSFTEKLQEPEVTLPRKVKTIHQTEYKDFKTILFWNLYFEGKNYEFGLGQNPFINAGCRMTNCFMTDDRNLLNISDAVLFHADDFDLNDLPNPRHRQVNQRYIFYNYETLVNSNKMPIFLSSKNFFNWTMTYRRDSDIFDAHPYGALKLRKEATNQLKNFPNFLHPKVLPPNPASLLEPRNKFLNLTFLTKKSRTVAWFVSNCHTNSLREEYFAQVGQHIPIDVYGRCGELKCLPWKSIKCDELLDSYKFYIAAENAICADYITEKFYRALASNVVPIVYGGADYSAFAPPHSYIHVGDFNSPKDLADYLRLLDKNELLYLKYFDWKMNYEVVAQPPRGWCDLCEKLNDFSQQPKAYEDIEKWWFHKEVPCLDGNHYLHNLISQKILFSFA